MVFRNSRLAEAIFRKKSAVLPAKDRDPPEHLITVALKTVHRVRNVSGRIKFQAFYNKSEIFREKPEWRRKSSLSGVFYPQTSGETCLSSTSDVWSFC
jgi:hypothetical protein